MKLRGFFEIIVVVILLFLVIDLDFDYDEAKSKKYIDYNDNENIKELALNDTKLSADNKFNEIVHEYINDSSSPIFIGISNIDIDCHGKGSTKDKDENLVNENIKVKAYFSLTPNGERHSSIVLEKKEKVYIHIINEYTSEEYPISDVECEYNIRT